MPRSNQLSYIAFFLNFVDGSSVNAALSAALFSYATNRELFLSGASLSMTSLLACRSAGRVAESEPVTQVN